jgi:hypothetical protein
MNLLSAGLERYFSSGASDVSSVSRSITFQLKIPPKIGRSQPGSVAQAIESNETGNNGPRIVFTERISAAAPPSKLPSFGPVEEKGRRHYARNRANIKTTFKK